MNKPNQVFLIGGGYSLREGIDKNLFQKLENKFSIGLNFSHHFFKSTFTCFVDPVSFYRTYNNEIKEIPLLVGRYAPDIKGIIQPNTIFLKQSQNYKRDLSDGVYQSFLCGLWALSIAIYLLDSGEIYLLGFDGGSLPVEPSNNTIPMKTTQGIINIDTENLPLELIKRIKNKDNLIKTSKRAISHWYQGQLEHRGVGKIKFYHESDKVNRLFKVYENETQCSIFNISPKSNITIFPKITYDEMFAKMDNETYPQDELRTWIRDKLSTIPKGVTK